MNGWTTQGILAEAESGEQVLVVSRTHASSRELLDQTMGFAGADSNAIARRAHGDQAIEFPSGGRIRFQGERATVRGLSASTVVLVNVTPSADTLAEMRASCPSGRIFRA